MSTQFIPALHYDFLSVSSTIVPDITDHGYTGVIRGDATGGAFMDSAEVFGTKKPVLTLKGGNNGGYLQLPDGVADNTQGFSVSFFACIHKTADPGCVFSFGEDGCFYLLAHSIEEDPDTFALFPALTAEGRSQEQGYWKHLFVKKGQWFHMVLSMNTEVPSTCNLYIDGTFMGSFSHRRKSSLALSGATLCCFGYGTFAEAPIAAQFTDIRIYHQTISQAEVNQIFSISPAARFSLEQKKLASLFETPLTSSLSLPQTGAYGCSFTWSSSHSNILSETGCVHRPIAGSLDTKVTLSVTMHYENNQFICEFPVTVSAMPDASTIVNKDLENLHFVFPMHTISDVSLPSAGNLGSVITWKSNQPAYLDENGHIFRDTENHTVTLTAAAAYDGVQATKDFTFTVLAAGALTPRRYRNSIHVEAANIKENPLPLASFVNLTEVSLHGNGILTENQKRCVDYLLLVDADRMLYNFRSAFGQDTKGARPLGGWEEPAGLLRGHSTGHLLSALAYGYASTKHPALKEKADYMISELRSLQLLSKGNPAAFQTSCTPSHAAQSGWSKDPSCWGEGFLSAYSPDQFALLEQFTPYATIWAPYYTLHKILAGLIDNYRLCSNQTALDTACGIADWVCSRLNATTKEQRAKMWSMYIAGEYGGMNESLAALSKLTGISRYMDTAALFDNPKVFDGLAKGEDTISGIHANQHIPQMIGAVAEYQASGISDYYQIGRNFWHLVINHYTYSIGGVGRGEIFKEPDILAGNIEGNRNCETCAVYNMLKLTAMLYAYEPDCSSYMDYYERALLNQIAASQSPKVTAKRHNGVTYMLPIGPGAVREYSNDYDDFTCCHGTGMENHVKYGEQIYHTVGDTLYVNLYLASVLNWTERNQKISMDTAFPSEWTKLTVHNTGHLKMKLRVPSWCSDTFRVTYQDKIFTASKGYLTLEEDFLAGDTLLIHTPFSLHLCFTPDVLEGEEVASIMYGPIVMVAKSASSDWITLSLPADAADGFVIDDCGYPQLRYENLELIPMYLAHHMPYHTYFKIKH